MVKSVTWKKRIILTIFVALFVPACEQAETPQNEYQPRWQKVVDSNPSDGSKNIQMLIGASNDLPSQENPVVLVLSCAHGITDAYVVWRRYLGVYDPDVTWRVGSDPSVRETWLLSTDNEATFAPEPIELISQMMTSDSFLIKTTPFRSDPVTMVFNTVGLKNEIIALREACAW